MLKHNVSKNIKILNKIRNYKLLSNLEKKYIDDSICLLANNNENDRGKILIMLNKIPIHSIYVSELNDIYLSLNTI